MSWPPLPSRALQPPLPSVHAVHACASHCCRRYVVRELQPGREDHGFVVMNRPHSVKAFVEDSAAMARLVAEEYIMIAETDHVWLQPLRNLATPTVPYAFHFGYMEPRFRAPLIERFCKGGAARMDPVGPSPLIIHVRQLRALVGPWLDMSHRLKTDADADAQLGWVLEMWGYSIAAACADVRHLVSAEVQFEGGSIGSHERPMAAFKIFHYTCARCRCRTRTPARSPTPSRGAVRPLRPRAAPDGIEYSVSAVPMELQVGHWSLDKRHYGGSYPPRNLSLPPRCAEQRARLLTAAFNEASARIANWPAAAATGAGGRPARSVGPDTWRVRPAQAPLPTAALERSALARRLLGTGPWRWRGAGCCGGSGQGYDEGGAVSVFFMRDGLLHSDGGTGAWALDPQQTQHQPQHQQQTGDARGDGEDGCVLATLIGVTSRLCFSLPADVGEGKEGWSFVATVLGAGASTAFAAGPVRLPPARTALPGGEAAVARGVGELSVPLAVLRRWAAPVPEPPLGVRAAEGEAEQPHAGARLEGSGFYRTWGCLLRAGVAWRGPHSGSEWQLWQLAQHHRPQPEREAAAGAGARAGAEIAEWGSGVRLRIRPLSDSASVPTLPYAPPLAEETAAEGGAAEPPALRFFSCWAFAEEGSARRHEWIMPQPAKRVLPGCASAELPRVGRVPQLPAEALAQRLLGSGTWAWAGIEGLRFDAVSARPQRSLCRASPASVAPARPLRAAHTRASQPARSSRPAAPPPPSRRARAPGPPAAAPARLRSHAGGRAHHTVGGRHMGRSTQAAAAHLGQVCTAAAHPRLWREGSRQRERPPPLPVGALLRRRARRGPPRFRAGSSSMTSQHSRGSLSRYRQQPIACSSSGVGPTQE